MDEGSSKGSSAPGGEGKNSTYEDILAAAEELTADSPEADVINVLVAVVAVELTPIAREKVLATIHRRTGIRHQILRQQLSFIERQVKLTAPDEALIVAKAALARHFADGDHLIRCSDGTYWKWVGSHWRETTPGELRKLLQLEAVNIQSNLKLAQLVSQAKTVLDDLLGTDEDLMALQDPPVPAVNCANGEVWIEADGSVHLRPHRPQSRFTYCLPIEFDPQATCPRYDKALLDIFARASDPPDLVRHWHEFVGYVIQPRRDIASFWLFIGHGGNGKSKLLETVQHLLGPDAMLNEQIATFHKDRFNLAALAGKLLFVDDDLPTDAKLNDGLLKKLSEAKAISARHAYGRRKFRFQCLALLAMACNTYPVTDDVSFGLVRRAQVLPFNRRFDKDADPQLFPEIWDDELSGVLNRALDGLKRLRQRGTFMPPIDCIQAREDFLVHANPLISFIADRCIKDTDARTYLRDFRIAIRRWAADEGVAGKLPGHGLKHQLEGLGYKVAMHDGKNRVFGLSLKPF